MRWYEISEASAPAEQAKKGQRAANARAQIANAQAKVSDARQKYSAAMKNAGDSPSRKQAAGQTYQSRLQSANNAQKAAQAKLRTR